MPSAMFAPLSLAMLGTLSVVSVLPPISAQAGIASTLPQCSTKDQGVCCVVLGPCTGQDDPTCDIKANSLSSVAIVGGFANSDAPAEQYGCYGGLCLLALNLASTACSLTYQADACAVCEPVYGKNPRGELCSYQVEGAGGCCYLQAGGNNPDGFQGCKVDADCQVSGFPGLETYQCVEEICFFYTSDDLCNSNYQACDAIAFENNAIHRTCNALSVDASGAPVPDFFPGPAPGPASPPATAPAPAPKAPPNPIPTSSPSITPTSFPITVPTSSPTTVPTSSPTVIPTSSPTSSPAAAPTATPAAVPTGGSHPTGVPATIASTPPVTPTPVPAAAPAPAPVTPPKKTSCIAVHQTVLIQGLGARPIASLSTADMVLTGEGYQPYLGSMHDAGVAPTLVLSVAHNRSVELSHDHLVKTAAGFVPAAAVTVGSLVATVDEHGIESLQPVLRVAGGSSEVAAPLTRSGTIVVHGVVLSCHAVVRSHAVANAALAPVRLGIMKDLSTYVRALVWLYHRLPGFIRAQVTPDGVLLP